MVNNRPIFLRHFSEKGVNFVSYIMNKNDKIMSWNDLKKKNLSQSKDYILIDATCQRYVKLLEK